ncbi:MAG: crossover junction endodeoxyribonuclease RuvC [Thermoanaerobaculales bacterium]
MLGLDPGSRVTGWGLVEGNARQVAATQFGCVYPVRGPSRAHTLASLGDQVTVLLERLAPDVVAIETPFAGQHPRAALALAEARGAILASLGRWGGEVVEYEPARVKAAVVGNGRAEKQQVGFIVRHALHLESSPPVDAADALAVALCHLRRALP